LKNQDTSYQSFPLKQADDNIGKTKLGMNAPAEYFKN